MGVGQHPAYAVGDDFGRDRESELCTAAWPCTRYGVVVHVDEGKDWVLVTTTSTQEAGIPLAARDRQVIAILLIAAFVVILNETIMSVALPRLMLDLDISARTVQWLTTAFMLTMAVVIPTTGFLLQRISTRTVFMLAMGLFSAGTLLAALSPGFWMLLFARVVQASEHHRENAERCHEGDLGFGCSLTGDPNRPEIPIPADGQTRPSQRDRRADPACGQDTSGGLTLTSAGRHSSDVPPAPRGAACTPSRPSRHPPLT
jgi:hypothetical protein